MIVENLVKNYGDTKALKNISFTVESPAFVGIIGIMAVGESTLLEILMGIKQRTPGTITFDHHSNSGNFFFL